MIRSIRAKILALVAAGLLVTMALVVTLASRQVTGILDQSHRHSYEEKVATVISLLARRERRLEATGMRSAYQEAFQQAAVKALRQTYYHAAGGERVFPFILNKAGEIVMHPVLAPGDTALAGLFRPAAGGAEYGETCYPGPEGGKRWAVFGRFPAWGWTVVWSVPEDVRNAEAISLRRTIFLTMSGGFLVLALLLSFLISRITRPLASLGEAARAMAAGDLAQRIEVRGRDEISELARAFIRMRDVVREKIAQLLVSEKQYRDLVESSNSIILRWDNSGRVLFLNRYGRRFFGFTAEEIVGRHVVGTIVPETDAAGRDLEAMIRDILQHPEKYESNENENACKDGRRVFIQWTNRVIVDDEGSFQEMLSVGIDITKRRELEAELRQAQKMEAIGTLAGGIAHDFNNILSAVIGYTELALLKVPAGGELAADLSQVVRAGERARELVQQILTFGRRTEQQKQPVRLSVIVKEDLKLLRSSIPSTIEIKPDIKSEAMVLADPTQIHQVVMNLCTNAYQAMRKTGGLLEVALREVAVSGGDMTMGGELLPEGRYVILEVGDTGCGMDDETKAKIFEPYFTTKAKGEGTGLGLAVVHGIVQDHQGRIAVYSEPGQGSVFRVYLPVVEGEAAEGEEAAPERVAGGMERIMLVDDEPQLRALGERFLSQAGYRVEVFGDAAAALAALEKDPQRCDLLITDMAMPGMDGAELAQKAMTLAPGLPVIICTGYSETLDRGRAQELGIRAYLQKPLIMTDLLGEVRRILDQNRPGK